MKQALNPYEQPQLTERQAASLLRFREDRLLDGDVQHVQEAIYKICNPYPNTHTSDTHDVAFLNGRHEVWNIVNTICDLVKLESGESQE